MTMTNDKPKPKRRNDNNSEKNSYIGRAGEFAVMSEFCQLGYNATTPGIDIGYDVVVGNDRNRTGSVWRIQVKTGMVEEETRYSKRYQFNIKRSSVIEELFPELHFIFVMRWNTIWRYAIFSRSDLENLFRTIDLLDRDRIKFRMTLHADRESCGERLTTTRRQEILTDYLDNWATWPVIESKKKSDIYPAF